MPEPGAAPPPATRSRSDGCDRQDASADGRPDAGGSIATLEEVLRRYRGPFFTDLAGQIRTSVHPTPDGCLMVTSHRPVRDRSMRAGERDFGHYMLHRVQTSSTRSDGDLRIDTLQTASGAAVVLRDWREAHAGARALADLLWSTDGPEPVRPRPGTRAHHPVGAAPRGAPSLSAEPRRRMYTILVHYDSADVGRRVVGAYGGDWVEAATTAAGLLRGDTGVRSVLIRFPGAEFSALDEDPAPAGRR